MDQLLKTNLTAAGVDVEAAVSRLMGNEALLERLLRKFAADANFAALKAAVKDGNREQALAASHTLKGMTGNLSMTVLFDLFSRQVEAIRGGDWERAVSLMDEITPARERVLSLIETL